MNADMSNNQTEIADSRRENFLEFAAIFSGDIKTGLTVFYNHIVDKKIIPYKIQMDKTWEVRVIESNAFSYKLTFHNVIIEDGRHPREILLTDVFGERTGKDATGRYRIRFVNGLLTEGTVKESAFTFDDVSVEMKLWNYNYTTYPFAVGTTKIPWRMVCEPVEALVTKWKLLGEAALSEYEIENAILFEFLQVFLEMYLDNETSIGYGKSTLTYDKTKLQTLPVTKRMLRAGRRLFELCRWHELAEQIEQFDEDRHAVFALFVMKITNKEGRILYDHIRDVLHRCCDIYPVNPEIKCLKDSRYQVVRETLNTLFKKAGYRGAYPDFSMKEKPAFIETSFVYERKYTYINEKQKMHMYSFIESYVDGGVQICAIHGKVLARRIDEKMLLNQAAHCCFSDDGRRSAKVTDSLFFTEDMPIADLKQDITGFFKRCIMGEQQDI